MSTTASTQKSWAWLLLPLALFAFVALSMGVIAHNTVRLHPLPPYFHLFFSDVIHMKVWLATLAIILATFQLFTVARLYEKLHFPPMGRFWGIVHRTSGFLAIGVSMPVAYHCIFLLGFSDYSTRVLAHSLLGTAVYAAFLAKVLVVQTKGWPGWLLPVAGGVLFTILLGLWLTSSVWFFATIGTSF